MELGSSCDASTFGRKRKLGSELLISHALRLEKIEQSKNEKLSSKTGESASKIEVELYSKNSSGGSEIGGALNETNLSKSPTISTSTSSQNSVQIPNSAQENAPFDLILEFMSGIMKEDYKSALGVAHMILKYEEDNETIREYLPVLEELISLGDESESESEDETSSQDSSSDSEHEKSVCSTEAESYESSSSGEEEEEESQILDSKNDKSSGEESVSSVESDEYLSEYGQEYIEGDN